MYCGQTCSSAAPHNLRCTWYQFLVLLPTLLLSYSGLAQALAQSSIQVLGTSFEDLKRQHAESCIAVVLQLNKKQTVNPKDSQSITALKVCVFLQPSFSPSFTKSVPESYSLFKACVLNMFSCRSSDKLLITANVYTTWCLFPIYAISGFHYCYDKRRVILCANLYRLVNSSGLVQCTIKPFVQTVFG